MAGEGSIIASLHILTIDNGEVYLHHGLLLLIIGVFLAGLSSR